MTYGYDNANRLTSVTDWNSNSTTYSYDDAGRMTSTTLPSGTGIVSTNSYDNANRLTGITHVKNGSTTVASVAYTLDDVGNRTQRVDQQGTHTYAYDDLYRLTSVTYPGPSTTTYDFDAFGNRTEMTVGSDTTTYDYDDADRLTTVTPPSPASAISYTWDDNGNLTDRGSDSLSWGRDSHEDRMVSATVNSVTTSFAYRGDGLRHSRTVGMTTTTVFTWDIVSGLPVVLDDGNQYVYGAGLTAQKQSGNWYYYLADGLGSTMAVVDSAGAVQKSYQYDVYGEATPSGGLANEFDFAGQQTDATGLQYLRARYYDPETGTFLSREPLAVIPTWTGHPSIYALGSPVSMRDPSGRKACYGSEPWQCEGIDPPGVTVTDDQGRSETTELPCPVNTWCYAGGLSIQQRHYNDPLMPNVTTYHFHIQMITGFKSSGQGGIDFVRAYGECLMDRWPVGLGEYHFTVNCHGDGDNSALALAGVCAAGGFLALALAPPSGGATLTGYGAAGAAFAGGCGSAVIAERLFEILRNPASSP